MPNPPITAWFGELFRRQLIANLDWLEGRQTAVYGNAEIAPLVLTDAYQNLTFLNSTLPFGEEGFYSLTLNVVLVGTNANAEAQFRVTTDGVPVFEGYGFDVGNSTLTGGNTFYFDPNLTTVIQGRGTNTTLNSGTASASRVGF